PLLEQDRSALDRTCRSSPFSLDFARCRKLTKLPPPRHNVPRMRSAPEPPGPSPVVHPNERSMSLSRKLWLATLLAAVGLLTLFAASASAKSHATVATGGTINVDLQSDLDYSDPALDYY